MFNEAFGPLCCKYLNIHSKGRYILLIKTNQIYMQSKDPPLPPLLCLGSAAR